MVLGYQILVKLMQHLGVDVTSRVDKRRPTQTKVHSSDAGSPEAREPNQCNVVDLNESFEPYNLVPAT